MPTFNNSPFASLNGCALALGIPSYGWGSFNSLQANTRFTVNNGVSLGGTATLTGVIDRGNIPIVGNLLTTQVDNANFSVTNIAISALSINAADGTGTISYLNASNVPSTPVTGMALIPVAEVAETMVNGGSQAFCFQSNDPNTNSARSIKVDVNITVLPSTGKVTLQSAINRVESEFVDILTITNVVGGVQIGRQAVVTLEPGRWYRFNNSLVSNVPATTPKIISKMLI